MTFPAPVLVNPISVRQCTASFKETSAAIADLSFVRLILADPDGTLPLMEGEELDLELHVERFHLTVRAATRARGNGWVRLSIDRIVPSARAHLKSFLCPKKIGESLSENWERDGVRHYHGLNESELWYHPEVGALFTYLDDRDPLQQFYVRVRETSGSLEAGRIARAAYLEISSLDGELGNAPIPEKELFERMGECRDVVTNFRPVAQWDYTLKQRLLRALSDKLYSTGRDASLARPVSAAR